MSRKSLALNYIFYKVLCFSYIRLKKSHVFSITIFVMLT
ncbi:hypothetical protein J2T18_000109 [Paenibacillus polymyxa]|nr:hypothetical protein [Paenibacillus polymyxa]